MQQTKENWPLWSFQGAKALCSLMNEARAVVGHWRIAEHYDLFLSSM